MNGRRTAGAHTACIVIESVAAIILTSVQIPALAGVATLAIVVFIIVK